MKKRLFSGIQPSGKLHIGNYLGAISQFIKMQSEYESIFCIVDLHAITVSQDPKKLRENIYSLTAWYLASGIDPEKSNLFIQSHIHEHAELAWIINTIAYMGELSRMTQYKEKALNKSSDKSSVALFDYPVLMAADILLYQADIVPVGEDQKQHVELTRTLAKRFNNRFGIIFKIPDVKMKKSGSRIMGLDNPAKKMSKSAPSEYNYILLGDIPDMIRKKISKSVTDSENKIAFDSKRTGLYNLLTIYENFSDMNKTEIENKYTNSGYGDFKKDLSDLIIEKLTPIQKKYNKLIADKSHLEKILEQGKNKVKPIAQKTLSDVKDKIGLL